MTRYRCKYWFLLSAGVYLLSVFGFDAEAAQSSNGSAQDVLAGELLFQRNCSSCHGGNATGGRGPNLRRRPYRHGNDDAQVFASIQGGLPGMPFNGLNDRSVWKIVAYLRSLSSAAENVPGDPSRGRELFFGKADCAQCHMVNGIGGRQGPDLSWIGWRLGPDGLRSALVEPNSVVDPQWWRMSVVTNSSNRIAGYVIDEDQFNIRLLDNNDALHALRKRDLRRLDRQSDSLMPAFGQLLSDTELTDVVAYLASLSGSDTGA